MTAPAAPARMTPLAASRIGMTLHQFRYDLRALLRNRQAQFFTLALPVMFLVIFASVFGGHGNTVKVAWRAVDDLGLLRARAS